MIYKTYGPPGTGKTHRLINRAKAYVRGKRKNAN
jgi:thymidine kinase